MGSVRRGRLGLASRWVGVGRSVGGRLGTVGPWRPCSNHGLAVWMDMTRTAVVLSLGWHWGGTGGGTVGGDGAKESEGWDGLSR